MKKNILAENMRRFNTKNLKEYEKKHGPNQNPDRHKVNIDDIDVHSTILMHTHLNLKISTHKTIQIL